MSIPIKPIVVYIFMIGLFTGLVTGILFPFIGESYFTLYFTDVEIYAGEFSERFGIWGSIISILTKNLAFITVLIIGPYIIANSYFRSYKDPKKSLVLFTVLSIFTYGFFPYGLFLANLFMSLNKELFFKWILYFIPHGIVESIIILWAGTTALNIKELYDVRKENNIIQTNYFFKRLLLASIYLLITAIIETLISPFLIL